MALARKAFVVLAWLYVLGVVIQFLITGIGLPQLGNEGMDTHEAFGYSALHLTPILLIILAFVAKAPVRLIVLTLVFAVVAFVQPIWATEFQGEFLASLHVLGALVIFYMAHVIARQATHLMRAETPPAG